MHSAAAVALLLFALSAGAAASSNTTTENSRGGFDYFYLVQQWPATFCNDHSCAHSPPRRYSFTVHGLWPQRRDGTWPEYCDSTPLHMQDIYDLVPDLEKAWPSWAGPDEQFWYHEWTRHGTCASRVIRGGQHAFFQAVLRLHDRVDILAALKASGIRPSNSKPYPVQDLKDAIDDEFGVMPHITCDGEGQLAEVWMCLSKKLKLIDCVDGPHPHQANQQSPGAPSNYNCNMVKLPKLRRRLGDEADEADGQAAAVKPAAAAAQPQTQPEEEVSRKVEASPIASSPSVAVAGGQELPAAAAAALLAVVAVVAAAAMVLQLTRRNERDEECTAAAGLLRAEDGRSGV